jgi:hypothetical protein
VRRQGITTQEPCTQLISDNNVDARGGAQTGVPQQDAKPSLFHKAEPTANEMKKGMEEMMKQQPTDAAAAD